MSFERYYSPAMYREPYFCRKLVDLTSKKHLDWASQQPCMIGLIQGRVITNEAGIKVDCHHLERQRGGTSNDFTVIPLQHELHMEYHSIGHKSFEDKYAVDMKDMLIATLIERVRFLEEKARR